MEMSVDPPPSFLFKYRYLIIGDGIRENIESDGIQSQQKMLK